MDRKDFLSKAFQWTVGKGLTALTENPLVDQIASIAEPKEKKQRPPGAHSSENTFLELCTGCDACMVACPYNVILIDDLERRDPIIQEKNPPCDQCTGTPCIHSCGTGALTLSEN